MKKISSGSAITTGVVEEVLQEANQAAAICVGEYGAMDSFPKLQ